MITSSQQRWQLLLEQVQQRQVPKQQEQPPLMQELLRVRVRELLRVRVQALLLSCHKQPERQQR